MPRVKGTTSNCQSAFLRAFCRGLAGPAPHEWPSPAILRKWLRKDGFRKALLSLRGTIRFERNLHILAASLHGARNLHDAVHPRTKSRKLPAHTHKASTDLLRLTHQPPAPTKPRVRTRPAPESSGPGTAPPADDPYRDETLEEAAIRLAHPNCRPEVAIAFIKGEPHPFYDDPDDDIAKRPPDTTAAGDPTERFNSDGINRI
jgi:hypothetical protein